MKATGIVRKVDELGRITIPKELRKAYGINKGSAIEIFTDDTGVILRKYESSFDFEKKANLIKELKKAYSEADAKTSKIIKETIKFLESEVI